MPFFILSLFWHADIWTLNSFSQLERVLHTEPFSGNSFHFLTYYICTLLTPNSLLPLNTDARFSIQYLRTQCTRTSISLAGTLFIEQTSLVLIYTAFKGTRDDSFFIPLPTTVTVNTEDIFQKRVPH